MWQTHGKVILQQPSRLTILGAPVDKQATFDFLTEKQRFADRETARQQPFLMDEMHTGCFDLARRVALETLAIDAQAASVGAVNAGQHLDQRRFARAVFANQPMNRSRGHLQVDPVKRLGCAETFADAAQVQGRY